MSQTAIAATGTTEVRSDTTGKRCVACSSAAASNVVKDENFEKLMRFYWEGLSVDVKPKDLKTHDLCGSCFEGFVEFYDTNGVLIILERHLRTIQKSLISQAVKGVEALKKEGLPLLHAHKQVSDKWGNGIKSDNDDEPEPAGQVTTHLETPKEKGKVYLTENSSRQTKLSSVGSATGAPRISRQLSTPKSSASANSGPARVLRTRPPKRKASKSKKSSSKRQGKGDTDDDGLEPSSDDSADDDDSSESE